MASQNLNQNYMESKNTSELLTISQIAQRWKVSTETVKRRIRSGQLPALKLGRCVRINSICLMQYENKRQLTATI
jgi:excisionase family DNA binding protein